MTNSAGRKISQGMRFAKQQPYKSATKKVQPKRAKPQRAKNANPHRGHR